jgi:hypothetical protein
MQTYSANCQANYFKRLLVLFFPSSVLPCSRALPSSIFPRRKHFVQRNLRKKTTCQIPGRRFVPTEQGASQIKLRITRFP